MIVSPTTSFDFYKIYFFIIIVVYDNYFCKTYNEKTKSTLIDIKSRNFKFI